MVKYFRVFKMIAVDGSVRGRVYLKEGKRGFNLGSTIKDPTKPKAFTGNQVTLESKEQADLHFDKLVAGFTASGWLPRGDAANGRRTSFVGFPLAPGFVPPAPAVVESTEPATEQAEPETEQAAAPRSGRRR